MRFTDKSTLVGPLIFFLILFFDVAPTKDANIFLGIFLWVVINWLFTTIPLFVTGLFGVSLSCLLGITSAKEAFSPLADPLIFLFLGGFFIAKAFEEIELDKKLALKILNHPYVSGSISRTVFAVLALTAFISMWISNTACTAMMLPLVLGILKNLNVTDSKAQHALLMGTAYAATIGGLATPLGSPPNIIVIGMLEKLANIKLNFFTWVIVAMPIVLFLFFWVNYFVQKPFKNIPFKAEKSDFSFSLSGKDKYVILIFIFAVIFWFMPSFLSLILGEKHPISDLLDKRFNPGVVALYLASFLFVLPLTSTTKILNLKNAMSIDWASLLLFGTGLSLGQILFKVGIADWIGSYLLGMLQGAPFIIFLVTVVTFTLFFTELVSNTAAANIILPLLIGTALKAQINPTTLAMACAISCNLAFMLPVGTPPNAIVYGTGLVHFKDMARSGFYLNIFSIIVITLIFMIFQFFL